MLRHLVSVAVTGALAATTVAAHARGNEREAWDDQNAPQKLLEGYEDRLAELPLEGATEKTPWPDSYWPNYRGGLSWQWIGETETRKPSLETLRGMSAEQIASLSPAEKYDIYIGNYDYPLTSYEERRTSENHPSWWGLCHGWAQAAAHFDEPRPVRVTNGDGIEVAFGSADVKALLTFAQQYNRSESAIKFLGLRCNSDLPPSTDDPNCKGVNAGSLHILLANHIGVQKTPFMADTRRTTEVWTFPISAFTSRILGETDEIYAEAAPGTVKIVEVETEMRHVGLTSPSWEPVGAEPPLEVERLRYTLELDAEGRIIGGEWKVANRPDFLWIQTRPAFTGFFSRLGTLYEQATN